MRIILFLLSIISMVYSQDDIPAWAKEALEIDTKKRVEFLVVDFAKKGTTLKKEDINRGIYRFYESRKLSILSCANFYNEDTREYSSNEEKMYTYARAAEIIDEYFLEYYKSDYEKKLTKEFVSNTVIRGINTAFWEAKGISILGKNVLMERLAQPFGDILIRLVGYSDKKNENLLQIEESAKHNIEKNVQNIGIEKAKPKNEKRKTDNFSIFWIIFPLVLLIILVYIFLHNKRKNTDTRRKKNKIARKNDR